MLGDDLTIRLPFQFDPAGLQEDLETARGYDFASHPLQYHDGSWKVINLIYSGGDTVYKHEGDFGYGEQPPARTEVLERCPHFDEALSSLPGRIKMARLSALPSGGKILRHYDPIESIDFDNIRLHIPVVTHPKVTFYLGYRRRVWAEGEVWYGDFTFPHSIVNRSPRTRVHLIVDLEPGDDHAAWLPAEYMSDENKASRARRRARQKNLSWYHTRLEGLLGRGPRNAA